MALRIAGLLTQDVRSVSGGQVRVELSFILWEAPVQCLETLPLSAGIHAHAVHEHKCQLAWTEGNVVGRG